MADPISWSPSTNQVSTGQLVPGGVKKEEAFSRSKYLMPMVGEASTGMLAQGGEWLDQGQSAVQPVLAHLLKLLSGDPQAINEAVLPETRGVMAQYDTARRAMAEFTPRGGGQASAISKSRFDEATDIAALKAGARRQGSEQLGTLGMQAGQLGGQLESTGLQGLGNLMQNVLQKEKDKRKFWSDLGLGIGMIAAGILFPPAAGSKILTEPAEGNLDVWKQSQGTYWPQPPQ